MVTSTFHVFLRFTIVYEYLYAFPSMSSDLAGAGERGGASEVASSIKSAEIKVIFPASLFHHKVRHHHSVLNSTKRSTPQWLVTAMAYMVPFMSLHLPRR